jgi:anti-anti-sigma regulatory factor
METNAVWVKDDGKGVLQAFEDARAKLANDDAEVVVDFSSLNRIDSGALRALEDVADAGDGKGTKVVLRGVNINIYKVLKLMKLAPRFAFRT